MCALTSGDQSIVLWDHQRLGPNLAHSGIRAVDAAAAAPPAASAAGVGGRRKGGDADGRQQLKTRLAGPQTAVDDGVGLEAGGKESTDMGMNSQSPGESESVAAPEERGAGRCKGEDENESVRWRGETKGVCRRRTED